MARIAGVDLPQQKQAWIALTYIYGIGRTRAYRILSKANVEATVKVKDLAEDEVRRIGQTIQEEGGVAVGMKVYEAGRDGQPRGVDGPGGLSIQPPNCRDFVADDADISRIRCASGAVVDTPVLDKQVVQSRSPSSWIGQV